MLAKDVLIVPGLGGSGPAHWQSRWEARYGYERVEQRDWDAPLLEDWLQTLERAVAARERCVVVAHSLGCALVAQLAARSPGARSHLAAALLVAPADVEDPRYTPDCTRVFAPLPRTRLPFPARVIASSTDPYVSVARAGEFARDWGAEFENAGDAGHINADSGLGDWDHGHARLRALIDPA